MFYLHYNNRWIAIVCLLSLHIVFGTYQRRDLVPNYFICPGVSLNEVGTKPQVRLGVMFDEPVKVNISDLRTKLNLTDGDLIPGELLIPYTPLAVIAARQAEIINNDHHILHYHHLCLHYTFVAKQFEDIGRGAVYTYIHNRVRQFVNSILTSDQHVAHTNLMAHYNPLISVYRHWTIDLCPDQRSPLANIFLGEKHKEKSCTGYNDIALSILPSRHSLFLATYKFLLKMGWKKFGIITTCKTFLELWHGDLDGTVQITLYDPKDFITSFQPLQEHEINIMIFVGDLRLYLQMLLDFHNRRKSFVRNVVWVLSYYCTNFVPAMKALFAKLFTNEEVEKVQHELKGSIVVVPIEDYKKKSLTNNLKRVTRLYGYIADAITLHALAADRSLHEKASHSGQNVSDFILESEDYYLIAGHLFNESFRGYTGQVDINLQCVRVANTFAIFNFVPSTAHNSSFLYSLERKGYIFVNPNDTRVIFYHTNGTISIDNTLTFRDLTTNIPLDHIPRMYIRVNTRTTILMIGSFGIYVSSIILYLAFIYYQDKLARIYNEYWLYQDKDVKYVLDDSAMTFYQAMQSHNGNSGIGELNDKAVKIHKLREDMSSLTANVRKTILQILDLNHQNVCSFIGGILEGSIITGIMYEYCRRGSLFTILQNPHLFFNQPFRSSFAMDAIKGLCYLHSHKIVHGRLSSNNCVIDEHWVLKLTDYTLDVFHSRKAKTIDLKNTFKYKAPECRFQSCDNNAYSFDVFSYGIILMEMSSRQCLFDNEIVGKYPVNYDYDVSSNFISLIEQCINNDPESRPSAETIKSILKTNMRYLFQDASGVVDIYAHNLEEHIKHLRKTLQKEKDYNNTVLSMHMPMTAIKSLRNEMSMALHKIAEAVVICITFNGMEKMIRNQSPQGIATILEDADNIINGIASSFCLERIQSSGFQWVYVVHRAQQSLDHKCVNEACNAAIKILTSFVDRKHHVIPSVAVHCGPLTCGIVNESTLLHVVLGDTLQSTLSVMAIAPIGSLLISDNVKNYVDSYFDLILFDKITQPNNMSFSCFMLNLFNDCPTNLTSFKSSQSFQMNNEEDIEVIDLEFQNDETNSLSFIKVPSANLIKRPKGPVVHK